MTINGRVSFDEVAVDYDRMIDWSTRLGREIPQLLALFAANGVRSLVDFGCGTGRHMAALAAAGLRVAGADSSRVMRRLARGNLGGTTARITDSLSKLRGAYDGVMTIGNTLPSVQSEAALLLTFRQMRALTRPGGILLVQVRNYEELSADQVVTTGLRETPDAIYFRAYHVEPVARGTRTVHLHAFKLDRSQGRLGVSGTIGRLRGWSRSQLRASLRSAGYTSISFYSNYALAPFSRTASDIVGLARVPR